MHNSNLQTPHIQTKLGQLQSLKDKISLLRSIKISELNDVQELDSIVNAAIHTNELTIARQASKRAITIAPQNPFLNIKYCATLVHCKAYQVAEEHCLKTREKIGFHPELENLLAHSQSTIGKFTQAAQTYQELIKKSPMTIKAISGLAKIHKFKSNDLFFPKVCETVKSNNLPPAELAEVNFAMAKYYNDIQDYKQAWDCADAANKTLSQLAPFNRESFSFQRRFKTIQEFYDKDASLTFSKKSQPHVLIVGMPRSGTSLIEFILANHKHFYSGGEAPSFEFAFEYEGLYEGADRHYSEKQLTGLGSAYEYFYSNMGWQPGQSIINKVPYNFINIGIFKRMFPNGKIIYLQRDYRDIAASVFFTQLAQNMNFSTEVENINYFTKLSIEIMDFWQELFSDDIFTVDYEKFTAHSDALLRELETFLGLEEESLQHNSNNRVAIETPSLWQARQKVYSHAKARFKRYPVLCNLPEDINKL